VPRRRRQWEVAIDWSLPAALAAGIRWLTAAGLAIEHACLVEHEQRMSDPEKTWPGSVFIPITFFGFVAFKMGMR